MRGYGRLERGVWLCVAVALIGCSGKQDPGEAGDECYRNVDCKPGLVCVPSGDARVCSSDLTGLESTVGTPPMEMPEMPPPEGTGATGATGGTDATGATGGTTG